MQYKIMKNLKEQVAMLLDETGLYYNINETKCRFELDIPMNNAAVSTNLYYDEKNEGLYNLSCLTFSLPKSRTTALLCKINEINNGQLSPSHLFLGDDDNRLGAQSVIYVTESGIDKDVFLKFVSAPVKMLDDNYEEIMRTAFGAEVGDKAEKQ